MPDIHLIDLINWERSGPVAKGPAGEPQPVFLHQGELDGACGLYSVVMSLLICGVVDLEALVGHAYDGRQRLGKFMGQVRTRFQGLVIEGTYLSDLRDLIAETFASKLEWEYYPAQGHQIRRFVAEQLMDNHPVIVGLRYSTGGHAVVAVGYEGCEQGEGCTLVRRFLLLDPSRSHRLDSPWNASIRTVADRGRWPYRFDGGPDGGQTGVTFDTALALWPKG